MAVQLRKLEPSDLPLLYAMENDEKQWGETDTHNPLSQKDLRDYILSSTGDIYKDGQLRLVMEIINENVGHTFSMQTPSQSNAVAIGAADLFDFDPRTGKAALGLYVVPCYRGKGIAQEVVRRIEEYAFDFLHLRMLYIFVQANNTACLHLFNKIGWQQTAILKSWVNETDVVVFQRFFAR